MLKPIATQIILLTLIILLYPFVTEYSKSNPVNLRVDYRANPIGIENKLPIFSWQINDNGIGAKQTGWQILVASSPELLNEGKADLWDSGKQLSSKQKQIVYGGKSLTSSTRYYWTVKIWDKENNSGDISESAFFETAYLDSSDWKGSWITNTEDTSSHYSPYIRKIINAQKKLVRATAYVAGVGYHELYVNNKKVSDTFLDPGFTRYDRRTLYLTYDVTNLFVEGKNCVGVILGNGWFNVQTKAVWNFHKAPWRKSPRLLMNVRLQYEDGSIETISTDESWKFSDGPIRFNSLYAGEEYDARLEKENWSSPDYNDAKWMNVIKTKSPGGILSAQSSPSIKIIKTIKPLNVISLKNGKYLFDMGENFAGIPRLTIQGKEGTKVTMRFGERINPDSTLNVVRISEHARIAKGEHPFQTDYYTLNGKGIESYTPHFTYHGYQYVEVTTEPAVELTKENLEGLFLSTGTDEVGSFTCSSFILNKLYSATMQSYRSNFYSIPTDCPQREKNGWTGDAQISCETGLWNFDGIQAYRKWLQDLRDEQQPTGVLPAIVPTSGWGYEWGNGPAWDAALIVIPWELYQYYGDVSVLNENYEAIKRYVDYLTTREENGIITIGLGDWLSITNTPEEITSTSYYYYDALTLSRIAKILDKEGDYKKYSVLAEKIKNNFNNTFFVQSDNQYKLRTQTALSCALYQGLTPDKAIEQTVNDLIKQVKKKNFHPDFGLLGSKYVLNALHNSGNNEVAFKMLNNTDYPGWGHWITKGATTLFEDWDGASSLNHIFLGDFVSWYFKALAGINLDPVHPGFDSFTLKPAFVNQLTFVDCSYNSINGEIISRWKRENDLINWEIKIPANTNARITIPDAFRAEKVLEIFSHSEISTEKNNFLLEAGSYKITIGKN